MKNDFVVFGLLLLSIHMSYAYELPDATSRTLIFSDQLNDAVGSANFMFNATHYIGMQKVDKERIAAYKAINPAFIVVQYHKSYGVDLQQNITSAAPPYWNNDCDTFYAWVNRNPSYGDRESYYLHYSNTADSIHRIKHFWNNVNEYYLADVRHAGWRQYVAEVNVWRCQNIGFDGTFFDASYFPSYGYDPENWFDSVPYSAGGITNFGQPWNQTFAVPYWSFIRNYFHAAGRDYLCLVNCDQMVTGWYNDSYLDSVDGAMAEGFFTYGGKLVGSDWSLSAGRILKYLTGNDRDKVLIAQCGPDADNQSLRRWCMANYLLLKNKYSYYNIVSGSNASWWPEYNIELDSFVSQPASLNDLLVEGTVSLYRREYKAGMVLVNPGADAQSCNLSRKFNPVTFSGGGDVTNGAKPQMAVTYGAAVNGSITVAAGEVLILRRDDVSIKMGSPRAVGEHFINEAVSLFTITGRLIGVNTCGRLPGSLLDVHHGHGIYLIRHSDRHVTSCLTLTGKQK
jgi:hypothetical protein